MRKTAGRRTAAATCSIAANIDAPARGTPGCRLRARLRARLACALEGATPGEAKAYQAALDQFKLGNYPMAVSAMQGFLVTYPGSSLAANAQYWIGMAYSGQRDYKSAIAAQRKLLAAWPDSPKAPDAMLSIASAQETMGERR